MHVLGCQVLWAAGRVFHTLLAWRRDDRPAQMTLGARQPPERTRYLHGSSTNAASFSRSSLGESRIPIMPSDHGWVTV